MMLFFLTYWRTLAWVAAIIAAYGLGRSHGADSVQGAWDREKARAQEEIMRNIGVGSDVEDKTNALPTDVASVRLFLDWGV